MKRFLQIFNRIRIVMALTYKEAIRRRLLMLLLICCILFMGAGAGCMSACRNALQTGMDVQEESHLRQIEKQKLTEEERAAYAIRLKEQKENIAKQSSKQMKYVTLGFSFSMIAFWLFLIGGLFTPFLAMNDFHSGHHVMLLSRPVQRWEYLTGKYLAILGVLCLNLLLMLVSFHLLMFFSQDDWGWEILSGALILIEGMALYLTMMLFMTLLLGRIGSILVSMVIIGITILPGYFLITGKITEVSEPYQQILYGLAYGLPQFSVNFFYALGEILDLPGIDNGLKVAGNMTGLYSIFVNLAWFVIIWIFMVIHFTRRDIHT